MSESNPALVPFNAYPAIVEYVRTTYPHVRVELTAGRFPVNAYYDGSVSVFVKDHPHGSVIAVDRDMVQSIVTRNARQKG